MLQRDSRQSDNIIKTSQDRSSLSAAEQRLGTNHGGSRAASAAAAEWAAGLAGIAPARPVAGLTAAAAPAAAAEMWAARAGAPMPRTARLTAACTPTDHLKSFLRTTTRLHAATKNHISAAPWRPGKAQTLLAHERPAASSALIVIELGLLLLVHGCVLVHNGRAAARRAQG